MINGEAWEEGPEFADENGEFSFNSSFESGCYDIQVTATEFLWKARPRQR